MAPAFDPKDKTGLSAVEKDMESLVDGTGWNHKPRR